MPCERISREELTQRWAMTYAEDGYEVRAKNVVGLAPPQRLNDVDPDIEASKPSDHVLVRIIDSAEDLASAETHHDLAGLEAARGGSTHLHLVVVAECASGLKERMDNWNIHPDTVHVT